MSIKTAIYDFLIADAGINAAVGGRIHSGRLPKEKTLPAIVLTVIDTDHHYSLANEVMKAEATVQVDVWDRDPQPEHVTIAELVRLRLSGYRGALNGTYNGETFEIVRNSELNEPPKDGSDNWLRRISMDFRFFHNATVPTH